MRWLRWCMFLLPFVVLSYELAPSPTWPAAASQIVSHDTHTDAVPFDRDEPGESRAESEDGGDGFDAAALTDADDIHAAIHGLFAADNNGGARDAIPADIDDPPRS